MKILGITLPYQILIGILLGAACGVFFGEPMRLFEPIGDGFIMLLKMSILPYITAALIQGVGSLTPSQAGRLLKMSGIFLLLIWIVVIASLIGFTLVFPAENPAYFYGSPTTKAVEWHYYLSLFLPANPFHSLANNIVPAVVIFSLFFGAALMFVKPRQKEPFLNILEVAVEALGRITKWIITISPIGIFALIASTVGTIRIIQLEKLEIYLISFIALSIFFTFIALPALVTSLTRIGYRELIRELQPPLLLAFSTGNMFVAIPYVMKAIDKLSETHGFATEEAKPVAHTLVPIAYNLPLVGNLMAMFFILFLDYYYGVNFTVGQLAHVVVASLVTLAGPVTAGLNSISFLVDTLHLPQDGVALFAETFSITRNLQALAGTFGLAAFTILTLTAFSRKIHFNIVKLGSYAALSIAIFCGLVLFVRWIEPVAVAPRPVFMDLTIETKVPYTVYRLNEAIPPPKPLLEGETNLDRIRRTKNMRVGYNKNSLPFTYFNDQNKLVGYDIELVFDFAQSLGATVEFVPFHYDKLGKELASNSFDFAVSSISVIPTRLEQMTFTTPTNEVQEAFIVKDYLRTDYASLSDIKRKEGLRLGVGIGGALVDIAHDVFPLAMIIQLDSYDDGYDNPNIDAMLWTDKEGLTWSLMHPTYTIVVPYPPIRKGFYAFAAPLGAQELVDTLNYWIQLRQHQGFLTKMEEKWVEGKTGTPPPRWSVIRNVLHWTD